MDINYFAEIESETDGSKSVIEYSGELFYIVSLRSGDEVVERRLVPVATDEQIIRTMMTEMVALAVRNAKHLRDDLVEAQQNWDDENYNLANDYGSMLEEIDRGQSHLILPTVVIGIAARNIEKGEILKFNPGENTDDILVRVSFDVSTDVFDKNVRY